jgi:hypothetical protein
VFILSGILLTTVRIFELVILTLSTGLAIAMAVLLKTERYRRVFLFSFGLLTLTALVEIFQRLHNSSPWSWETSPLRLSSAIAALIAILVAFYDQFK